MTIQTYRGAVLQLGMSTLPHAWATSEAPCLADRVDYPCYGVKMFEISQILQMNSTHESLPPVTAHLMTP